MVNFATSQFCKRCNISLANSPVNYDNSTQIINNSNNTAVRPTMPLNQPVQPQFVPPIPPPQAQYNQPFQPQPQYQPNQNANQPSSYQSSDYTLPRFPQEQQNQYQAKQNQYQQSQYQQPHYSHNQYQQNQFMAPQSPQGVWRRGNEVIVHKHASFPTKCVKCGQDFSYSNNGSFSTQKYRWHNPLVYIAVISPLIYLILAACLSERFSFELPYCQTHLQERETTKNYLIGGGFAAFAAVVLTAMFGSGVLAFGIGLFAIIALLISHEYVYKPFRVKSVDGQYVYLQGATQDYLNTLPY